MCIIYIKDRRKEKEKMCENTAWCYNTKKNLKIVENMKLK